MSIYYRSLAGKIYVQKEDRNLYLLQKRDKTVNCRKITQNGINPLKIGLLYAGSGAIHISDWEKQEI